MTNYKIKVRDRAINNSYYWGEDQYKSKASGLSVVGASVPEEHRIFAREELPEANKIIQRLKGCLPYHSVTFEETECEATLHVSNWEKTGLKHISN